MLRVARRFGAWIRDRLLYVDYRLRRRRRISKTKKEDSNIYPLW